MTDEATPDELMLDEIAGRVSDAVFFLPRARASAAVASPWVLRHHKTVSTTGGDVDHVVFALSVDVSVLVVRRVVRDKQEQIQRVLEERVRASLHDLVASLRPQIAEGARYSAIVELREAGMHAAADLLEQELRAKRLIRALKVTP